MKKTHIGSSLNDFLQEDRLLEAATTTATKRGIARQIAMEMKRLRLTKLATARRMKTSRAALDRHLDLNNSLQARHRPRRYTAFFVPGCGPQDAATTLTRPSPPLFP